MSTSADSDLSVGTTIKTAPRDVEQGAIKEKPTEDRKLGLAHEPISPWHPSQFPDGGTKAWLCLAGSFACLFCSFGWLNSIGVFQAHYQTVLLRQYSPSTIAWISSCEIFVMFLPGPLNGFVYDNYGPRPLLIFGAFFHVFGLMMTSLCQEYWQFVLAQGICSPLGLNAIFSAATNSVASWFLKKRGAAFGIQAAGSGLGGVIFPIMTSHLIPRVGFGWTMRICAFLILGLLILASGTVESRLPPKKRPFELKVFAEPWKDLRYILTTIASFLFFMGVFVPINFIEVQAAANGMSHHLATYLISILNAASIFGRVIPGALADKFGRFNMQTLMSFFAAIVVLALALPASTNAAYIVFAVLYGFASGAYVALIPVQIAYIAPMEKIGVYTGVCFTAMAFAGLAGNPAAGAIAAQNMDLVDVFAGVLLLAGAVMFAVAKLCIAKWNVFAKV